METVNILEPLLRRAGLTSATGSAKTSITENGIPAARSSSAVPGHAKSSLESRLPPLFSQAGALVHVYGRQRARQYSDTEMGQSLVPQK
jgi:hypothetical protein